MVLDFGILNSGLFPESDAAGDGMGAVVQDKIIWNDVGIGIIPIGGIVAWLKTLAGCPPLLPNYVECNGQVLADGGSLFNGATIPNLNASGGGTKRFLRGSTTSGTIGGTETHKHSTAIGGGTIGTYGGGVVAGTYDSDYVGTLPSYYEVVWVMRVK